MSLLLEGIANYYALRDEPAEAAKQALVIGCAMTQKGLGSAEHYLKLDEIIDRANHCGADTGGATNIINNGTINGKFSETKMGQQRLVVTRFSLQH